MKGTTNENLRKLISGLKKHSYSQEAAIWNRVASDLEKPARKRLVVNLSRISRSTKENETIVVPGKVLGSGAIGHSIVVAALAFSGTAKKQIESAKGKCLTISELTKKNPKGKDVRVIG